MKEIPRFNGFTRKFYQKVKEQIPILLKISQKTEKGILPNLFYKANITWITKTDKDTTQGKETTVSLLNRDVKIVNKN